MVKKQQPPCKILQGARQTKLLLRGVDFEDDADGAVSQAELDLQEFAYQYAKRLFPLQALPYTSKRKVLFDDLCSAGVALMPSWHEGFGLVGWEAIAAGVPLVLGKNSGLFRLLETWGEGLYTKWVIAVDVRGFPREPFFSPADLETVANAILRVAADQAGWNRNAEKLRLALAKDFTWRACAAQFSMTLGWTLPTTPLTIMATPVHTKSLSSVAAISMDDKGPRHIPKWKDDEPAHTKAPAPTPTRAPHKLKVFLCASADLLADRNVFELYFRQQNDDFQESGVYLEIKHWESLPRAISATRSMDECIATLQACDIFISLFDTKVGQYAEEEFDAAYQHFKANAKPWVFTFFKAATIKPTRQQRAALQSLWDFQEKLEAGGHVPTEYQDANDLKLKFVAQLKHLLQGIR